MLDHLGLSTKIPPRPPEQRKRVKRTRRLGAGFGGIKRRDIGKQPIRANVEIILPSIQEEPRPG